MGVSFFYEKKTATPGFTRKVDSPLVGGRKEKEQWRQKPMTYFVFTT